MHREFWGWERWNGGHWAHIVTANSADGCWSALTTTRPPACVDRREQQVLPAGRLPLRRHEDDVTETKAREYEG